MPALSLGDSHQSSHECTLLHLPGCAKARAPYSESPFHEDVRQSSWAVGRRIRPQAPKLNLTTSHWGLRNPVQDLAHSLPVLAGLAEVKHRFLFLRRGPDRDVDGTAVGPMHLCVPVPSSLTQEALLGGMSLELTTLNSGTAPFCEIRR